MTDNADVETHAKAVKAIAWSAIDKWGAQGLSLFTLWILARMLGPEPFGLIALASAFTRLVQIFVDQGMTEAIIREPMLDVEHLNAAFWANLAWSAFLFLATYMGANFIAGLYKEPQLSPILRWLSLGFVLSALSSTQISYLRRQMRFRSLAIRSVLSKTVAALVAVGMALLGFGVWSLVAQLLVMSLAGAVILWSSSDWHPRMHFSRRHFRSLFSFGVQITGSRILSFINAQLHDFLIGFYMGSTALGYFSVANNLTKRLVDILRNVILDVAYPAFSRYQDQPARLRVLFDSASQFTALLIFPVFTFIFFSAPELVSVLFGPEWTSTIPLTRILALMGGVYALIAYFSQLLMAVGEMKILLRVRIMTLLVNALGFVLSLKFGLIAVTGAYVATWYIITPFYYVYVHQRINLKGYIKVFADALAGVCIMGAVTWVIRSVLVQHLPDIAVLLLCFLAAGLSYSLSLLILAPRTVRQLQAMIVAVLTRSKDKYEKSEESNE